MRGRGQDLGELAGQLLVGPQPVRGLHRLLRVLSPAHLEAALHGLSPPPESRKVPTSSASGLVQQNPSPMRPASVADFGPKPET